MFMELPKQFKLSFAEVSDEKLLIYQVVRFEDMMYELTYALRGEEKCVYCEKELKSYDRTLDHRYPRDTGGRSITNNLFPCCSECNSQKTNLTHDEYLKIRDFTEKERKQYLKKMAQYNKEIMRKIGFKLPKKWVTFECISDILYKHPEENLRGKKYYRILGFYNKYQKLPRPIIIDKNNRLLDGYNILLFSEDFEIKEIPVIKLENVEIQQN